MGSFGQLVSTLTDPTFLITVLTGIAAFATVYTIILPIFQGDKLKARMKGVSTHREELRRKHLEEVTKKGDGQGLRGKKPSAMIKEIVVLFKLNELLDENGARKKLSQAGFRGQGPVFTFMFARLVMPFIASISVGLYINFVNDLGIPSNFKFTVTVLSFLAGFYLPNLWVQNAISKRKEIIQLAFPDALDLMLICVESGMSIEAAFNKVAQEVAQNSIELAEELSLTTAELSYLQDRTVAYKNLADRTGVDGVKAVVTALTQAERYGTPLGQTLRVLAKENRDMRMQKAEKKAAALPAKLTVPMITFFLPALFVVIIGPSVISVMGIGD